MRSTQTPDGAFNSPISLGSDRRLFDMRTKDLRENTHSEHMACDSCWTLSSTLPMHVQI